jgi:V8-like Glu-specific endopeptidase
MRSRGRHHRRRAVTSTALALAAVAGAASAALPMAGGLATASTVGTRPDTGIMRTVSPTAQRTARAFWTPSRMAAATPAQENVKAGKAGPPPGTPTAVHFGGVPTAGALFYTTGTAKHFCTASVVNSGNENLVLTAAHCVYNGSYASNIEFVPGYHSGLQPYGAWAVKTITVAAGWQQTRNPNLDVAFLAVTPPSGTDRPIQSVTGGLRLGINRPYRRDIEVIAYNDAASRPVECSTKSFEFDTGQLEFYCRDFMNGSSGAPWIVRYVPGNGTGLVIGVIGGFELGGDFPWASYSPYFGSSALALYRQAEGR